MVADFSVIWLDFFQIRSSKFLEKYISNNDSEFSELASVQDAEKRAFLKSFEIIDVTHDLRF